MQRTLTRYTFTVYLILKGFLLLAMALVLIANGGIDPISHAPSSVDIKTVLLMSAACLLILAPLFYGLEAWGHATDACAGEA
jgi:hypothetical protein